MIVLEQVSPEEAENFQEVKSLLGENDGNESNFIAPFPLLTKNAVESLRYRAEVIIDDLKILIFFSSSSFPCIKLFNKSFQMILIRKCSFDKILFVLCLVIVLLFFGPSTCMYIYLKDAIYFGTV